MYHSRWIGAILAVVFACLQAGCFSPPLPLMAQGFHGKGAELAAAASEGDVERINHLIRVEHVNPDTAFADDSTPVLAVPVLDRNYDGLKALLDNGANPNAKREAAPGEYDNSRRYHNNAMVMAARLEDPRFLKLLLEHGGDPDTRNVNNETLLDVAFLANNRWENVKLLALHGADLDAQTRGAPVMADYASFGDFVYVYWLLEHGADPTFRMTVAAEAPMAPDGTYPPQKNYPTGRTGIFAPFWALYGPDGEPVQMTYQPILEDIFWKPPAPSQVEWQKKCQQWVLARGIPIPPITRYTRPQRTKAGLPLPPEHMYKPPVVVQRK